MSCLKKKKKEKEKKAYPPTNLAVGEYDTRSFMGIHPDRIVNCSMNAIKKKPRTNS
jgi:hypothetical protein